MIAAAPLAEALYPLVEYHRQTGDPRAEAAINECLQPAPRGTAPWHAAMIERPARLAAIAKAVAAPGMSISAIADRVSGLAAAYERGRWRCDRRSVGLPADLDGTPQAECWWMLRTLGAIPGNRTIREELTLSYNKGNPGNPK